MVAVIWRCSINFYRLHILYTRRSKNAFRALSRLELRIYRVSLKSCWPAHSSPAERRLDIQYRGLGIGTVERFDASQIISFYVVPKSTAISLDGQRWCILHVLEQYIENISDLVDKFVEVVIERSIISCDDRQFGIIFEKHKAGKMHDLELVQRYPDGIFLRRRRLDFVDTRVEGLEVFRERMVMIKVNGLCTGLREDALD